MIDKFLNRFGDQIWYAFLAFPLLAVLYLMWVFLDKLG